jgi:hypothetical protein
VKSANSWLYKQKYRSLARPKMKFIYIYIYRFINIILYIILYYIILYIILYILFYMFYFMSIILYILFHIYYFVYILLYILFYIYYFVYIIFYIFFYLYSFIYYFIYLLLCILFYISNCSHICHNIHCTKVIASLFAILRAPFNILDVTISTNAPRYVTKDNASYSHLCIPSVPYSLTVLSIRRKHLL